MSLKGDIAKQYLTRFPNHADATIARKMYNENKTVFKDFDGARRVIRYHRGHAGAKGRRSLVDKKHQKPITRDTNPYKLPASDAEPQEIYKLPLAQNNILLISDLHIPYHDINAISIALDYGKKHKVNTIFINGDLMDFYQMSRFSKDPRKRSIKGEFDAAKEFLRILRKTFKKAAIYWLKGNHDKRYEHWLMSKAPEVFDDEYYHLEERLRLNEENIILLDDLTLVQAGRLFITHGHLILRGVFAPVNAARGVYTRTKSNTIVGHTHSVSEHSEKNLKGEQTSCWSTGCLCELNPDYAPFVNKYVHGFAHIETQLDGSFTVDNKKIINGKLM